MGSPFCPGEKAKVMIEALGRCALLAFVLFSPAVAAGPIKLKLAFITSDRSELYQSVIGPFVDVVNNDAKGLIEIEVYFSGVLGGLPQRPQLVLDGVADIATIARMAGWRTPTSRTGRSHAGIRASPRRRLHLADTGLSFGRVWAEFKGGRGKKSQKSGGK
jgi:hypothetical protein